MGSQCLKPGSGTPGPGLSVAGAVLLGKSEQSWLGPGWVLAGSGLGTVVSAGAWSLVAGAPSRAGARYEARVGWCSGSQEESPGLGQALGATL